MSKSLTLEDAQYLLSRFNSVPVSVKKSDGRWSPSYLIAVDRKEATVKYKLQGHETVEDVKLVDVVVREGRLAEVAERAGLPRWERARKALVGDTSSTMNHAAKEAAGTVRRVAEIKATQNQFLSVRMLSSESVKDKLAKLREKYGDSVPHSDLNALADEDSRYRKEMEASKPKPVVQAPRPPPAPLPSKPVQAVTAPPKEKGYDSNGDGVDTDSIFADAMLVPPTIRPVNGHKQESVPVPAASEPPADPPEPAPAPAVATPVNMDALVVFDPDNATFWAGKENGFVANYEDAKQYPTNAIAKRALAGVRAQITNGSYGVFIKRVEFGKLSLALEQMTEAPAGSVPLKAQVVQVVVPVAVPAVAVPPPSPAGSTIEGLALALTAAIAEVKAYDIRIAAAQQKLSVLQQQLSALQQQMSVLEQQLAEENQQRSVAVNERERLKTEFSLL